MSIYHIERGGHADMKRIYPMMEFDFHGLGAPNASGVPARVAARS